MSDPVPGVAAEAAPVAPVAAAVAAPTPAVEPAAPVVAEPAASAAAEPAAPSTPPESPLAVKPVDPAKEEAKPEEGKEPPKPEGEPPVPEPPKLEPIAYEFKFPEGAEVRDKARLDAAIEKFREVGLPPEKAQALMDLHVAEIQGLQQHMAAEQHRVFHEMLGQKLDEWKADPEIGRAGYETALSEIAAVRDKLLTPEEMKPGGEFDTFLRTTGAGHWPILAKMLYRARAGLTEPKIQVMQSKAPLDAGRAPPSGRRTVTGLFDHPSSDLRKP